MKISTRESRLRRHRRVRGKIRGTAERPRLLVFRSNRGIFAQLVDDDAGRTFLISAAVWPTICLSMPRTTICVGIGTSKEMPSRGVMRTVCEYPT